MKWMECAIKELGVQEYLEKGKSNPRIEKYHNSVSSKGSDDSVPWCAAFVGWVLSTCGCNFTGSAWARSYLEWGYALPSFKEGCVVVFSRGPNAGHVAFGVSKMPGLVKVLGGNQGDKVCYKWYPTWRVLGYRWSNDFNRLMNIPYEAK
jgi:uncharacterized protein (TIGR02594 family)